MDPRNLRTCHEVAPAVYLEYLGQSVELPVGETVIGRGVGCTLRFNDPGVSRRHLRFIRRQGELFVEDLRSRNGTLVNGAAVASAIALRHGDIVTVGCYDLKIRITEGVDFEVSTSERSLVGAVGPAERKIPVGLDARPTGARGPTLEMPVAIPPVPMADQRCPRCSEPVSSNDDECARCGYQWGGFRATSLTHAAPTPLNRRFYERHAIDLSLVYVSSELEVEALTRDLSESGVFVCSHVLDPLGTTCELTILIDGGPPLHIGGIVRRVVDHEQEGRDPAGMGIEFVEVGVNERSWLEFAMARYAETGVVERIDS